MKQFTGFLAKPHSALLALMAVVALSVGPGCAGSSRRSAEPEHNPVEVVVDTPARDGDERPRTGSPPASPSAPEQPIPTLEDFEAEARESLEASDLEAELDELESEIER